MLQRLLAALTLVVGALCFAQAPVALPPGMTRVQAVEGITEYRLPNGLQVLTVPDDSKPTTTVNVTYRVGSRHENYGESGMAHLLEHLMFKGSKAHPMVWAEFTQRGLQSNGTTSVDRTNYFASFAANDENLKWYLSWQADAMVNSFIAKKDLDSEMTVVRNEMESGENEPGRILWQRALATMFLWHNYGKPTIGARSDVENVDIGRLQAFYRQYYQPDNATLIVSGKFDEGVTLRWIADSFGPIAKPSRALAPQYTLEPAQDGERGFTLRRVGGTPMLLASYHVPAAADPRYPASEMLATILADEPSGRLHRRLVQKQLAAAVWGWSWDLHDPGAIMLGAQLAPGQDVEAARRELLATIESFASEPVTAEELSRAKAKWLKAWDLRFANPERVGIALSEAVAHGDWRLFFLLRDRVAALTAEQVQKLAVEHLRQSNRTLGVYAPTDKPERAPAPVAVDIAAQFKDFKGQAALAQAEAFDATPANIDARTQRFTVSDGAGAGLEVALLPKGARGGAVHAQLVLRFGDEKSLFGQKAAADFLASMLDKGSARLSRQQVQDRLDELRTEMSVSGSAGAIVVNLASRRATLPDAIGLVGELLREPALDAAVLEEVRRQALAEVEANRQEPEALTENRIARHANPYPRGDVRYARTFDEIEADTKAVTVEQLRALHRELLGASHAQFGAVGDMDAAAVKAALEKAFGGWKSAAPFVRVPTPLVPAEPARMVMRTPDKQNAVLLVRQPVPLNDLHADYPAFTLANWLLGGSGGDSRLWKRIREQDGLSYGVFSWVQWSSFEANSPWSVQGIFAPANREKVEAAFKEEVARALKEGFSDDEVKAGARGLLSFRKLSRAQDQRLASALASNLFLDRDFSIAQRVDDAISKLTTAQVNRALREYLHPDRFVVALAGDFPQP
jgi:zinc protease